MPAVKFFAGLDLEQKSSFLDGHKLAILAVEAPGRQSAKAQEDLAYSEFSQPS